LLAASLNGLALTICQVMLLMTESEWTLNSVQWSLNIVLDHPVGIAHCKIECMCDYDYNGLER
jgi:hypothetical protein